MKETEPKKKSREADSRNELNSGRDNTLDAIRGVSIIIVMLGHCIVLNGLDKSDPFLYDVIKSVQMPLFMMLSGFLAFLSRPAFSKLKKRAVSYLVPFFSWFVVSFFIARIRDAALSRPVLLSPAVFFMELKDLLFQTDRGLWFLMTIFVITLVMTVSCEAAEAAGKRGASKKTATLVFCLSVFIFYLLFFLQARSGFTLLSPSLTVQYMPFYLLGFAWAKLNSDLMVSSQLKALAGAPSLAAFFVLAALFDLAAAPVGAGGLILQFAASALGTFGAFVLMQIGFSGHGSGMKAGTALSVISLAGRHSLEIYALHFRFARLLGIEKRNVTLYSLRGLFWLVACFVLMSVLTALVIFCLKRVPPLYLVLFGKKPLRETGKQKQQ